MATIDLGKIKFNWRGTYAGGTAYVPDDVVYYEDGSVGSSYMCVANTTGNAPSSGGTPHASWEYLAKGQAPIPTTTQGDIVVRGASTNERLAIGSAGQILKVNNAGNGLTYTTAGLIQSRAKQITNATSISTATTFVTPTGFTHTITPTSASNHIIVTFNICYASRNQYGGARILRTIGGSDSYPTGWLGDANGNRGRSKDGNNYAMPADNQTQTMAHYVLIDTDHNTTNEITYSLQQNSYQNTYNFYYNRSHDYGNNNYNYTGSSSILLQEVSPTS